jgi:hypothetical protein
MRWSYLAVREYAIPGTRRRHLGEKTIQGWYTYRAQGLDGLMPKARADRGQSKLSEAIQAAILAAKRDNPRRSIRQIRQLLETAGTVARGSLSRSTIHRLLQQHGLSRLTGSASLPEERRSFVAASAGAIWYSDVAERSNSSVSEASPLQCRVGLGKFRWRRNKGMAGGNTLSFGPFQVGINRAQVISKLSGMGVANGPHFIDDSSFSILFSQKFFRCANEGQK